MSARITYIMLKRHLSTCVTQSPWPQLLPAVIDLG